MLLSFFGLGMITVGAVGAFVDLRFSPTGSSDVVLNADLKKGSLRLGTADADGFVAKVLNGFSLESRFDLGVGYSMANGLHFQGSSALEIQLAPHVDLGPVAVEALTLNVGIKDGTFPVAISADVRASLGPLVAVVKGWVPTRRGSRPV